MGNSDELYAELKSDIQALAGPLFDASHRFVLERGAFVPHGAILTTNGETRAIMAAPPGFEQRLVSAIEVLPVLHEALQTAARKDDVQAVAVCEDVKITPEGQKQTAALKVLVEHRRGLCVALYMPYRRKLFGGYRFGSIFVRSADPELSPWPDSEAT